MKLPLLALLVFCAAVCQAQSVLDLPLNGSEHNKPLTTLIDSLEKKHPVHFFFLPEWVRSISLPDKTSGLTLRGALDEVFQGQEMSYTEMYPGTIVIIKDPTLSILRQSAIAGATRDQKKIQKYSFGSAGQPKQKVTISGTVKDSQNGDPLVGATILLSDSTSTTTNPEGRFNMRVPSGEYLMTIAFVNYDEMVIDLAAYADGKIDAKLEEVPTVLQEVIVQDRAEREIIQSRICLLYTS